RGSLHERAPGRPSTVFTPAGRPRATAPKTRRPPPRIGRPRPRVSPRTPLSPPPTRVGETGNTDAVVRSTFNPDTGTAPAGPCGVAGAADAAPASVSSRGHR